MTRSSRQRVNGARSTRGKRAQSSGAPGQAPQSPAASLSDILKQRAPFVIICAGIIGSCLALSSRFRDEARFHVGLRYGLGLTTFYCVVAVFEHAVSTGQEVLRQNDGLFSWAVFLLQIVKFYLWLQMLNLGLTAVSQFLTTYVWEDTAEPSGTLGRILDARLSRHYNEVVGWCQGTWEESGASGPELVFGEMEARENVLGKLAWYLESLAVGFPGGVAGAAVSALGYYYMGWLSIPIAPLFVGFPDTLKCTTTTGLKVLSGLLGLSLSDSVYQYCLRKCEPEPWALSFRSVVASFAVHSSGVIGHKLSFRAMVRAWRGDSSDLERRMQVTGLVHALTLFPSEARGVLDSMTRDGKALSRRWQIVLGNPGAARGFLSAASKIEMDAKVNQLKESMRIYQSLEVMIPLVDSMEGLGFDMVPVKKLRDAGEVTGALDSSVLRQMAGGSSAEVRAAVDRSSRKFVEVNCAAFNTGPCDPNSTVYGGQPIHISPNGAPVISPYMRSAT